MTPAARAALGAVDANDGIFWMDVDTYKTHYAIYTVAFHQEWQQDQKKVQFDRTGAVPLAVGFNNPATQAAIVGFSGFSQRMFMQKTCNSQRMIDNIYFYSRKSSGAPVKEADSPMLTTFGPGTYYTQLNVQTGQGWIVYDALPAGDYTISANKFRRSSYSKGGTMPLTFQTFGASSKLTIS